MKYVRTWSAPVVLLLAALLAAACSNPVGGARHASAQGIVLRQQDGTAVFRLLNGTATGSLTVPAGQQSVPLVVRFLDASGNELAPAAGYWLKVTSENAAVAQWSQATTGEFAGRVVGGSAGTTRLRFELYHGPIGGGHEDHTEFVSVTVTP